MEKAYRTLQQQENYWKHQDIDWDSTWMDQNVISTVLTQPLKNSTQILRKGQNDFESWIFRDLLSPQIKKHFFSPLNTLIKL